MALSPIKMFQNDQSSLAQILAGGNQTLSGIMDKAIQIGRDISNKQLAQERDLLAMRQQETNLFQRRAENTQQNIEDAQRFARSAFESDRRYGLDTRQEERQGAKDLFSQGMEQSRLGLSERGVAVSEGGLALREQEAATEEARRKQLDEYYASKYGNAQEGEAPASPAQLLSPETATPAPSQTSPGGIARQLATDPASMFGGTPATPAPAPTAQAPATTEQPPDDLARLYQKKRELMTDMASAKDPRIKARIAAELGPVEAAIKTSPAGNTAAGARAEESLRMRKEAAAQKAAEDEMKTLVGDTSSFVPQVPQAYKEGATKKDLAQAQAFDKDMFSSEINAALNRKTPEEYVNLVPGLSDTQKAKRRKLWEFAHKQAGTAAPGAAPSPVRALGL